MIISQVTQTITDLDEERIVLRDYLQYVSYRICTVFNREHISLHISGNEGDVPSDDFDNRKI